MEWADEVAGVKFPWSYRPIMPCFDSNRVQAATHSFTMKGFFGEGIKC